MATAINATFHTASLPAGTIELGTEATKMELETPTDCEPIER